MSGFRVGRCDGGSVMVARELEAETDTLDWDRTRTTLVESSASIRETFAGTPPESLSEYNNALLTASGEDMNFAFLHTLRRHDIDTLDVPAEALNAPETAVPAILLAGRDELRERGLPDPDVSLYRDAMTVSEATGIDYYEALSDLRSREPVSMRADLSDATPTVEAPIATMPEPDLVASKPEIDGPVEAAQQYDVHVMAYPLKSFGLLGWETRDSHGFVVVTERGVNLMNEDGSLKPYKEIEDDIKIITRGGPDNAAAQTLLSPDSSLPDEMSETQKTNAGNVYIADHNDSMNDLKTPNVFHIQTYEVTHDLETMREMVDAHRRLINREDIDYEMLNRNSNTYTGDVTELLTGERPDFTHVRPEGHGWRRLPAFGNDLTDYSKTEFAEEFGYDAPERELPGVDRGAERDGMQQDASYREAAATPGPVREERGQDRGVEDDYGYDFGY